MGLAASAVAVQETPRKILGGGGGINNSTFHSFPKEYHVGIM